MYEATVWLSQLQQLLVSVSSGGATAAEVEAVAGEKGGLFVVLCGVTVADGDDVQGRLGSKNI